VAPVPSGAFFSVQLFVCAIPKEGTPSLRFCKGGRRCCWGYLICYAARGMINSQVQAFPSPRPSQSARRKRLPTVLLMPARSKARATRPPIR
jgi:hypothetical protein